MVTIIGKCAKPCFERDCQSEQTAMVKFKDGTFAGVLCMEHLYERLKVPEKKTKEN